MNTNSLTAVNVPYLVKGIEVAGQDPRASAGTDWDARGLSIDSLVWPRDRPTPLFPCTVAEIIEILEALGAYLRTDEGGHLAAALDGLVEVCGVSRDLAERSYAELWRMFDPVRLNFQIEQEFGGADVLDGWREVELPDHNIALVRAFPARLVHVLAGNAPGSAGQGLVRGALTRGVNLLKMPSNDLFTAPALLRSLNAVASAHPIAESFSAVYWRGGDTNIESVLLRSQFFDKLVVWGGADAVNGVAKYVGPGLELVAFDPKSSISIIGNEAFESEETLTAVAVAAATDATLYNQEACTASRFQFVQGTVDEADRYCDELLKQLPLDRALATGRSTPPPLGVREEINALRNLPGLYRVVGRPDGTGLVVRSSEPVDFYPSGRVVNVVPIAAVEDAISYVNAATQTVGIYPAQLKATLRDALCSVGVQRVVTLGMSVMSIAGLPHDGFYPMQRLVRWSKDEA